MSQVEPEKGGLSESFVPKAPVYWDPVVQPNGPAPPVTVTQPGLPIATEVHRSDSREVMYRHESVHVICYACNADIWSATSKKPGVAVYGAVFMICLIGCVYGCCLIPCCVPGFHDTIHTCPQCKAQVGLYEVVKFS